MPKLAGRKLVEKALCNSTMPPRIQRRPPGRRVRDMGCADVFHLRRSMLSLTLVPFAGFSDDLGVLVCAVITVNAHITEKIEKRAAEKMKEWFDQET